MNFSPTKRKRLRRWMPWITAATVIGAIIGVYRWSEPGRITSTSFANRSTAEIGIHLKNAPFSAYSGGHKTWSLWAKSIDLEHDPSSGDASFQSASLTDIRDGVLYRSSPAESAMPLSSSPSPEPSHRLSLVNSSDLPTPAGPPEVKFHAGAGHYFIGSAKPLPSDISGLYTPLWQLQLTGKVSITTQDGNALNTESLIMMELSNLKSHTVEQRLECDSGATVSRRGVTISANRIRYSLNDHTVELLDGVRGSFKEGSIQTQRTFWSLTNDVVQSPDPSTGILDGDEFSAQSITLDLKNGKQVANHGTIHFRTEKGMDFLPISRR